MNITTNQTQKTPVSVPPIKDINEILLNRLVNETMREKEKKAVDSQHPNQTYRFGQVKPTQREKTTRRFEVQQLSMIRDTGGKKSLIDELALDDHQEFKKVQTKILQKKIEDRIIYQSNNRKENIVRYNLLPNVAKIQANVS